MLELVQAGAHTVEEWCHFHLGPTHRPGMVVSLATAGDLLQWNSHLNLLVTDDGFDHEGVFSPLTLGPQPSPEFIPRASARASCA